MKQNFNEIIFNQKTIVSLFKLKRLLLFTYYLLDLFYLLFKF